MVLAIPIATIIAFEHWFRDYGWTIDENGWGLWYVGQSLLVALALGKFATWLVFWIGLKTRSTLSAIFISLGTIAAICLVPQFIAMATPSFTSGQMTRNVTAVLAMNPATLIRLVEEMPTDHYRLQWGLTPELYPWLFSAAVTAYFALGVGLKQWCLSNADGLLGRSWSADEEESQEATESAGTEEREWDGSEQRGPLAAGAVAG
jgi:hypothetical protein